MNIEDCPSFEKCEAPLCLLYEHKEFSVWWPEEEICNKNGTKPDWVKKQRRIKKKARDKESYYTIEMLQAIHAVTKATRGLDAEGKRSEDVFIKRRTRPAAGTTPPALAQNTPLVKANKGYDPHAMPKTTQARMFS